ncbi:MAG TPA: hypothetical protein VN803_06360 [Gemmatimonadales bacterium]|nr:hypothetical protein [Gemmatimonadales bacterium]
MTTADVHVLATKIDRLHDDVIEVKQLAGATNGRVREIEKWRAKTEGFTAAFHWPALLLATVAGAFVGTIAGHL